MYQVITYSKDSGTDEKLDYRRKADAVRAAREYLKDPYYSGVCVWDLTRRYIAAMFGDMPDDARPCWRNA